MESKKLSTIADPFANETVPFMRHSSTIGTRTGSSGPVRPIGMTSRTPLTSKEASDALTSDASRLSVDIA